VFELSTSFPLAEKYALTDQVRRSVRSIGGQIAEAWAKRRYPRHFAAKLSDADGEDNETQHWLDTAVDCDYLTGDQVADTHLTLRTQHLKLAMPTDLIISARGLKRRYLMGHEEVWALAGVDLDIVRGEYVSIMGPSGSGKSTLFNMIGGLDRPTEGQVLMNGQDVRAMDVRQIAYLRCNKVGFIFQTFNLVEVMTAEQNVMLPMTFAGVPDGEAGERARQLLDQVGLGKRYDHRPSQLSGGQQQRVAIARALANDPELILADEPTGHLDLKTGEEIIGMLGRCTRDLGKTVISATHDHKMLAASDRVVYLVDGRITDIKRRDELSIAAGSIGIRSSAGERP
jgi:putative ABC transport system ATP-binding protein